MSAATEGTNSYHPCPRCLVPNDSQCDLLEEWPLRNQQVSKQVVEQANLLIATGQKTRGTELLKTHSLYAVKVRYIPSVS
jgi:hypothetical protein